MKTTTLPLRNSISWSPLRLGLPHKQQLPGTQAIWTIRGFLLVPLAVAILALSSTAQAQCPSNCDAFGDTALGNSALANLFTGGDNTAIGSEALMNDTTGSDNTATGANALGRDTSGSKNTANGYAALINNKDGNANTAIGYEALLNNISGFGNMASGYQALYMNTTLSGVSGSYNTASGLQALYSNTTGSNNTATGYQALKANTAANFNTANGYQAMFLNTAGGDNTATGLQALYSNTSGSDNTASGYKALFKNSTGTNNTASGANALHNNTTGRTNTATGNYALSSNTTGSFNTANGFDALENNTGSHNTASGAYAGSKLTTGSNNIDIGNLGSSGEANTIRIGNAVATLYPDGTTQPAQTATYIAGIRGRMTANANAVPVLIDSAGQLGTVSSSQRFKKEITPMDKASEAILALKPVIFHYKSDSTNTPQFGLIAEEVVKVNPDLVVCDEDGKPYTVRYEAVNAMLLNEFLKAHKKVQKLEAALAAVNERLKEQDARITKVNAKVELAQPALQVANNAQ